LTNIQGQQLMTNTINNFNQIDLDLSKVDAGLYVLKIRSDQGLSLIKIVKQ